MNQRDTASGLPEEHDRYSWADDYSQSGIEAWTVAAVRKRSTDEIIRLYGGDPDNPLGDFHFAQLFDLEGDSALEPMRFHIQVVDVGTHTVALENGYMGMMPEIARECSADGGQFFAMGWSVNSNPRMSQAIDGQVTAYFEMYSGDRSVGEPVPSWITSISVNEHHLRSTALAVMEQQTGVAVDLKWLTEARPTYQIPDPYRTP